MIEIQLTQGYVTRISDEDADLIDFHWCAQWKKKSKKSMYVVRGGSVDKKQYRVHMHRVILERVLKRPLEKGEVCDHIDRNPLNNTRENLRVCSVQENNCNTGKRSHSSTGYIGVSWAKNRQKYEAYVGTGKTRIRLGLFTDVIEAAKARDRKAIEVYGEFASLNFDRSTYEEQS